MSETASQSAVGAVAEAMRPTPSVMVNHEAVIRAAPRAAKTICAGNHELRSPVSQHHLWNSGNQFTTYILVWYSRYGWMDRFQNLDDIQLAVLLSLIAKRHCIVTTDEQHLDSLQKQLEKVGGASTFYGT